MFRAKAPILFQGEIPRHAFVVLDGMVRAYTITSNGEERIIALYGKGDVFPLSWAIGEATSALFYYEALSDVRVLAVTKSDFESVLADSPETTSALLALLGHEYTGLMLRITSLTQSRTLDKLAYTFYFLMMRHGLSRGEDYVINLKINQTMLAALIGQTREGAARNLKALVEKGVISYSGSNYTVHKKALFNLLGEDSFRELTG